MSCTWMGDWGPHSRASVLVTRWRRLGIRCGRARILQHRHTLRHAGRELSMGITGLRCSCDAHVACVCAYRVALWGLRAGNITATIAWNLINAYYQDLPYPGPPVLASSRVGGCGGVCFILADLMNVCCRKRNLWARNSALVWALRGLGLTLRHGPHDVVYGAWLALPSQRDGRGLAEPGWLICT